MKKKNKKKKTKKLVKKKSVKIEKKQISLIKTNADVEKIVIKKIKKQPTEKRIYN